MQLKTVSCTFTGHSEDRMYNKANLSTASNYVWTKLKLGLLKENT